MPSDDLLLYFQVTPRDRAGQHAILSNNHLLSHSILMVYGAFRSRVTSYNSPSVKGANSSCNPVPVLRPPSLVPTG